MAFEAVPEFLLPTRFKSGNNLVLDTAFITRLMIPGYPLTDYETEDAMNPFYLGCDVSKGYGDFVIIDAQKETLVENFQLDDTFEGHTCLYKQLESLLKKHPGAKISAGIESTGGYENNWYHTLIKFQTTLDIQTAHVNPVGITHDSKAGLQRNGTDKISARNIAEYLIRHPETICYNKENPFASLKKQWGFISLLKKQVTQLLNQLESLLYTSNPELLVYCRNGVQNWVLQVARQYPTARKLALARSNTVVKIPFVTKERAEKLIATAKKSVASAVDEVSEQLVLSTVNQILFMKKNIAIQEAQLVKTCSMPEVDLLMSFIGIGKCTALVLMLYIGSIERFSSAKSLAAYFGLHPEYRISGDDKKGRFRMSKKGQSEPRKLLYMAALSAIQANPLIRDIYKAKVEQGMAKKAAIGVCMHKIIRIVYGMLKSNTPFNPEIDLHNRNKAEKKPAVKRQDKSRRFHSYDTSAPISRRQNLKRMEQRLSQDGISPSHAGSDASLHPPINI